MNTQQIIDDTKRKIAIIGRVCHFDERFETIAEEKGLEIIEKEDLGKIPHLLVVFPGITNINCYTYRRNGVVKYAVYTRCNFLVVFSEKPSYDYAMLADDIFNLEFDIIMKGETVWRDGIEISIAEAADTKDIEGLKQAIREKVA